MDSLWRAILNFGVHEDLEGHPFYCNVINTISTTLSSPTFKLQEKKNEQETWVLFRNLIFDIAVISHINAKALGGGRQSIPRGSPTAPRLVFIKIIGWWGVAMQNVGPPKWGGFMDEISISTPSS
jgi:hypothetical protein